jgi:argonaute-like protein implicated in RNA metabolism and viral defense
MFIPSAKCCKMTVLSNHRLHSYKASVASHNRDITPKKRETKPLNKMNLRKRSSSSSPAKKYVKNSEIIPTISQVDSHVISDVISQVCSPVLSIMKEEERTITVWGEEYKVSLPPGYDIYEGLRRWYPSLYEAVIEKEQAEKYYEEYYEKDMELFWAHQDYLEWLCD